MSTTNSLNNSGGSISSSNTNTSELLQLSDDGTVYFPTTDVVDQHHQQSLLQDDDSLLQSTFSHSSLFSLADPTSVVAGSSMSANEDRSSIFDDEEQDENGCKAPNCFNMDGVHVGGKGDVFDNLLIAELLPNSQSIGSYNYTQDMLSHDKSGMLFSTLSQTHPQTRGTSSTARTPQTPTISRSASSSPVRREKERSPNSNILKFSPNNSLYGISRRQTYNSNKGVPEPALSMLIHPSNTALARNGINFRTNQSLVIPKSTRVIPEVPFRVLDAPGIRDDFYLNLLDWGECNQIAVGLNTNVFLWNANNYSVTNLFGDQHPVSSVSWMKHDQNILSVGTDDGMVAIFDVQKQKKIRDVHQHELRVGCLSWNGSVIASGSRDNTIVLSDIRTKKNVAKLAGHTQEICGLKWGTTGTQLASGGNDNNLLVWEPGYNSHLPLWKFTDHTAAVKGVCWSPYHSNLLVSGGGARDKSLKFWNTTSGHLITSKKTNSQICNIYWSKQTNELVTSHGFSQNNITVWNYPTLSPIANLCGHSKRVIYLTASPDGGQIVTGAGDESLRFWSLFSEREKQPEDHLQEVSLDIR